jgi:hypothetical protein
MTLAGDGYIPMPARWVFSDPGAEGEETYTHLERCKEYIAKKGGTLDVVKAANSDGIMLDAVRFAQRRANSEVKRYASIPMFIDKLDGTDGIMPRQCTSEYKIEPIERWLRRVVMGLLPRQRAPKTATVNTWIGISADEPQRATAPGSWRNETATLGTDLLGDPLEQSRRVWEPCHWQLKSFPLLGVVIFPDRSRQPDARFDFCDGWDRDDCKDWNKKSWAWNVPRSACKCCPYRTNAEWLEMRETRPEEWAETVAFDRDIREAYRTGRMARGELNGVPYLHRSKVPLDMVDLTVPMNDRKGCGGLFSLEPDGICGV